jgi:O-antigen/teichoic acid export membrane protein
MPKKTTPTQDVDLVATPEGAQVQGLNTADVQHIKRKSVTGALSYAFRTVALQGVNATAAVLLSMFLSVEEFGVYGFVVVISSFFTIISDIGLGASLIQKQNEPNRDELRTIFTVQQALGWTVCVLIILTAYGMMHAGKLTLPGFYLAAAFGLSFPIVSLKTISSLLLERRLEFNRLVIPTMVEAFVFNIIAVFFAWKGLGVLSYAIAVLARSIIGVIVMWSIEPWDIGLGFSKKAFNDLMKVGLKFQLNDMLAKAKDELFTIIVRFMLTEKGFGYVQWATKFANMPRSFTIDSVLAVTFPTYSRLQQDSKLMGKAIEKTVFFITLIALPILAGFSIMFFPLIHVFPRLLKWEPALMSLVLFSISIAFSTISTPLVSTLNAMGKINITLRLMVMWTILQWVVTPICIHFYGFTGVALAQALIGLTAFLVVFLTKKYVPFSLTDQVWRQSLAAITMVVALYWLRNIWSLSIFHLIAGVMLGGSIYAGLMLIFGYRKVTLEVRSLREARG